MNEPLDISIHPPMRPSRPCRFCLSIVGGSVFADFDVDSSGHVYAVRVSFDGYGCCHASPEAGRLNVADSNALLAMIERKAIDESVAAPILRTYFHQNRDSFWTDALAEYGLVLA